MKRVAIQFVQEGEKVNETIRRQGSLEDACDWEMQVDLGGKHLIRYGGVVGPTRFPPDDPNDMLVSTAHWYI